MIATENPHSLQIYSSVDRNKCVFVSQRSLRVSVATPQTQHLKFGNTRTYAKAPRSPHNRAQIFSSKPPTMCHYTTDLIFTPLPVAYIPHMDGGHEQRAATRRRLTTTARAVFLGHSSLPCKRVAPILAHCAAVHSVAWCVEIL